MMREVDEDIVIEGRKKKKKVEVDEVKDED
jgi:hypothetical protein